MKPVYLDEYTYTLPKERIASYPLKDRDRSRLLFYRKEKISHHTFRELPGLLPQNTLLIFNDTRVIPARLHFRKETGAEIEIFLLTPVSPAGAMAEVMQAKDTCTWQCTIGHLKRWTDGLTLTKDINGTRLEAELVARREGIVRFRWHSGQPFAELIARSGETPLPPYIQRQAEPADRERYQTVYSHYEGAVAAPTAGLHFTDALLTALEEKKVDTDFLTLHVSAGTFQPVKAADATEHTMHNEQVAVTRQTIHHLLAGDKFITAVGTTSMRTLESLYWYGVKLLKDPEAAFAIGQFDPYDPPTPLPATRQALEAVAGYMDARSQHVLTGNTALFILPGYTFRVCRGLITNFHQPGSTLILLVAAFTGRRWKDIYEAALNNDYRFLSYGDSSLIIPGA